MVHKVFKGCTNPECISFHKRRKYDVNDNFCSCCGKPLHYVCASCWTMIDPLYGKYCKDCLKNRINWREYGKYFRKRKSVYKTRNL